MSQKRHAYMTFEHITNGSRARHNEGWLQDRAMAYMIVRVLFCLSYVHHGCRRVRL